MHEICKEQKTPQRAEETNGEVKQGNYVEITELEEQDDIVRQVEKERKLDVYEVQ